MMHKIRTCQSVGRIEDRPPKMQTPSSNVTAKERKAINDIKKDRNIIVLPADKGKITVVFGH